MHHDNEPVVGSFDDQRAARAAIVRLAAIGFQAEDIGMISKGERGGLEEERDHSAAAAADAAGGAVVGGLLGAAASLIIPGAGPVVAAGILATTLLGAGTGALAGGIVGALTGLGVGKEEAEHYGREFEAGKTLVTVQNPGSRRPQVEEILIVNARAGVTNR
jgi:hypothetical protein